MIWWGARNGCAQVGTAGVLHCGACQQDSWFTRVVSYRMRHVYSLFRWVTGRQLHDVCGNCGATYAAAGDPHAPGVSAAIPRFDRRGWLIGGGIVVATLLILTVIGVVIGNKHADYAQAPQVGDIYKADLARIIDKPDAPVMFGAMRIAAVSGDRVEMELAKTYYSDRRGVDRDVNGAAMQAAGYFAPDRRVFTRAALAQMYADGRVWDVVRPGETW